VHIVDPNLPQVFVGEKMEKLNLPRMMETSSTSLKKIQVFHPGKVTITTSQEAICPHFLRHAPLAYARGMLIP